MLGRETVTRAVSLSIVLLLCPSFNLVWHRDYRYAIPYNNNNIMLLTIAKLCLLIQKYYFFVDFVNCETITVLVIVINSTPVYTYG